MPDSKGSFEGLSRFGSLLVATGTVALRGYWGSRLHAI